MVDATVIVQFMKSLLGGNHHEAEICQSYMEIEGKDQINAAELAKGLSARRKNFNHWSLLADRIQVR